MSERLTVRMLRDLLLKQDPNLLVTAFFNDEEYYVKGTYKSGDTPERVALTMHVDVDRCLLCRHVNHAPVECGVWVEGAECGCPSESMYDGEEI